jgi:thiamine transport system permease protein
MKEISSAHILRYAIIIFFIFPLLYFVYKFQFQSQVSINEVIWALKNSVFQATSASFVVLLLALPMSFGLFSLPPRLQQICKGLLLLPQILPVFFTVLIVFSVVKPFPMGSAGIIILFAVINLGLATVMLYQAISEKVSAFALTAEVFSISKFQFFIKILVPVLYADLLRLFFLIFVFCISSFSIPLLAGDGRAVNLEMLVYEKIFIETNWSAAFAISLFQTLFIFSLSFLLLKSEVKHSPARFEGSYIKSKAALVLIVAYLAVYIGGYIVGLFTSLSYLSFLKQYSSDIFSALAFTLTSLVAYVAFTFIILYFWLLDFIHHKKFSPC